MTVKLRNFKPFFFHLRQVAFFHLSYFFSSQVSYYAYYDLPIFCELSLLYLQKNFFRLYVSWYYKKSSLSFSTFLFILFLNAFSILPCFLWLLWRFRVRTSRSSSQFLSIGVFYPSSRFRNSSGYVLTTVHTFS